MQILCIKTHNSAKRSINGLLYMQIYIYWILNDRKLTLVNKILSEFFSFSAERTQIGKLRGTHETFSIILVLARTYLKTKRSTS